MRSREWRKKNARYKACQSWEAGLMNPRRRPKERNGATFRTTYSSLHQSKCRQMSASHPSLPAFLSQYKCRPKPSLHPAHLSLPAHQYKCRQKWKPRPQVCSMSTQFRETRSGSCCMSGRKASTSTSRPSAPSLASTHRHACARSDRRMHPAQQNCYEVIAASLQDWFRMLNPAQTVPALRDGSGNIISDFGRVFRHLAHLAGEPETPQTIEALDWRQVTG